MIFSSLVTLSLGAAAYFQGANAFDASSNNNVAIYWGQNSAGGQERLSSYCDSDDVDIILLAFMSDFPGASEPTINFANACEGSYFDGTTLLKCDTIASDIETCQNKGKKVLLSLGGATGTQGFSSDSEAESFGTKLWNMFGEGSGENRPFGDSLVDGFDFDIENNDDTGYTALINKLREHYKDGSKDYYISAAPQCVYPDASIGDALENTDVDFVFIQFYNNNCNVDKDFNWDTWADYAKNTAKNSNTKLFIGLPGSSSAAGSGYITADTLSSAISSNSIDSNSNFGGVMIWDASQGFSNTNDGTTFVAQIKEVLGGGSSSSGSSGSSGSSSASSKSSSKTSSYEASSSSSESSATSSYEAASSSSEPKSSSAAQLSGLSENLKQFNPSSESSAVESTSSTSAEVSTTYYASASSSDASSRHVHNAHTSYGYSYSMSTSKDSESDSIVTATRTYTSTITVRSTSKISVSKSAKATTTSSSSSSTSEIAITLTQTPSTSVSAFVTTGASFTTTLAVSMPINTQSVSVSISAKPSTTFATSYSGKSSAYTTSVPYYSNATSTSSAPTSTPTFTDCSSLSGADKVICLNDNFEAGFYDSGSSTCTEGDVACSADGKFSLCAFGEWIDFNCPSGTTCYAYVGTDDVVGVGCNYDLGLTSY